MKVQSNHHNRPPTPAELEALRQFEASQRNGEALFHPQVAAGQPAPNCVAFFEETGRFAVTILEGHYTVEDGRWSRYQADDVQVPADNPLEACWQAAKSVRTALKRKLNLNAYVIAVPWFPDMEEDEDILDETRGRNVHPLFGDVDLARRLVKFPTEEELQTQLSALYIKREVAALRPDPAAPNQAPDQPALDLGDGRLVIQHVDVVNVYVNSGDVTVPPGDAASR